MRPVWAEINLEAISYNIRAIKRLLKPEVLFMAVVKANAYGHGAIKVAQTALKSGADRLGVALVEEGLELRGAGITAPIHILSEIVPEVASVVVKADLIPTVCSYRVVEALSHSAQREGKKVKVHLKVNTGMNRLGIEPNEVPSFVAFLMDKPGLELEGIFTHLAVAEQPGNPFTDHQIRIFNMLVEGLKKKRIEIPLKHLANSAAAILFPSSHMDMVRVGIALYGLHPSEATRSLINLKPALALKAKVAYIRQLAVKQGVSYGLSYKAPQETVIAVLPLGYADGYSRLFSNKSHVLIAGKKVNIVGSICMDQLMVDIGKVDPIKVGSEAVLIGKQGEEEITVDELASVLGTINYEIVCMIDSRVPRIYLD